MEWISLRLVLLLCYLLLWTLDGSGVYMHFNGALSNTNAAVGILVRGSAKVIFNGFAGRVPHWHDNVDFSFVAGIHLCSLRGDCQSLIPKIVCESYYLSNF